jgi:MoxR-like ATPase
MKKQPLLKSIRESIHQQIIGQEKLIDGLLTAILCDGHVLLEGVPGLAKTKTLKSLTAALDCHMERVQFTPDLLPSDIIGTEIYRPQTQEFSVRKGPIFCNLLLADEINRAPAKVQSALLQAMEEKQVTISDTTFSLPSPFLVLATQNPIEQEGTYPLPEAQLDRFFMKILITYPSFDEELKIIQTYGKLSSEIKSPVAATANDLHEMQQEMSNVYIDERLDRYIVSLIQNTRHTISGSGAVQNIYFSQGASPRGSISLRKASQAHAYLHGKTFVTPDDVQSTVHDVLRHRVIISPESFPMTVDEALSELIRTTEIP